MSVNKKSCLFENSQLSSNSQFIRLQPQQSLCPNYLRACLATEFSEVRWEYLDNDDVTISITITYSHNLRFSKLDSVQKIYNDACSMRPQLYSICIGPRV